MRVAVDLLGGLPRAAILEGVERALDGHPELEVALVGDVTGIMGMTGITTSSAAQSADAAVSPRISLVEAAVCVEEFLSAGADPLPVIRSHRAASVRVAHRLVRDGLADACVSTTSRRIASAGAVFGLGLMRGATAPTYASFVGETGSILVEAAGDAGLDLLAQQALAGLAVSPILGEGLGFGDGVGFGGGQGMVGVLSAGETAADESLIQALQHLLGGVTVSPVGARALILDVDSPTVLVAEASTLAFLGAVSRASIQSFAELLQSRVEAAMSGEARSEVLGLLAAELSAIGEHQEGGCVILGVEGVSICTGREVTDPAGEVAAAIGQALLCVKADVCAALRYRLLGHIERRRLDAGLTS